MAFIVYTIFSHRLDSIINQIENMCVNIVTAKREGGNSYELAKLSYEN